SLEMLAHPLARAHREDPARQALANIVLGIAAQREGHPRSKPAAEALAGRTLEIDDYRPFGQPLRSVPASDVAGEDPAHAGVAVADLHFQPDRPLRGRGAVPEG